MRWCRVSSSSNPTICQDLGWGDWQHLNPSQAQEMQYSSSYLTLKKLPGLYTVKLLNQRPFNSILLCFYSFIHFCWHLFETDRFVKVFRLVETDRLKCFYSFIHFCWDLFETDRLVKVFRWDPLSAHGWGPCPTLGSERGISPGRGENYDRRNCVTHFLTIHEWLFTRAIFHPKYEWRFCATASSIEMSFSVTSLTVNW